VRRPPVAGPAPPYAERVNPSWAVVVAAVAGLLAGLVAGVMAAGARRGRTVDADGDVAAAAGLVAGPARPAELPAGVAEVLNVLRAASVVLDSSGALVKTSPAAFAFGLVRGRDLVHPELREMAAEARDLGLVRERDLELPRGPLGRGRLVVSARVAPLGDALTLVLVEDRTDALRVEEIRRDFVGNVSHELKTPIGALHLLAEAVHDAAGDPDAVQHFAQRMQRESLRLSALVQEIINLSRLQSAEGLHSPDLVEVDEVVADAVDRHHLPASARSIDIVIGGDSGAVVYGDHDLLVTAVRNLVDNAVAYSADGTRVSVAVRHADGLVEIAVSDQGMGIAAADQDRIFDRFYRVDPARSRATGGTGLGLSIVKHVAANHGGEVTLWSVPGQGSTFTLRLPESSPQADSSLQADSTGRPDGEGMDALPDLPPDVLAGDDAPDRRPEPRGARA
jgi:two-component system, OmpR family, sensor histidine kinase SenX3